MNGMNRIVARARPTRLGPPIVALCLLLAAVRTASAENTTDINAIGVSLYDACAPIPNIDGAEEAYGFQVYMNQIGSGWTYGPHSEFNGAVYDVDFLDPDYSKMSHDDDTFWSDPAGTAIGFYMAHGICNDAQTGTPCTTGSQCAGGYCPALPPTTHSSACIYNYPRAVITCGSSSFYNNRVTYAHGNIKWGEDALSGSWAGAGTNGDDNVVFLVNSCGVREPYMYNQSSNFAGMQLLNMIMPSSNIAITNGFADTIAWTARGQTLATSATMNPNGAIRDAWASLLDQSPNNTNGDACPNLDSNFQYGGSHGIHGCGANVSIAMDSTDSAAQFDIAMTWLQARWNYSKGTGYWHYWIHCNYDCATYGWTK